MYGAWHGGVRRDGGVRREAEARGGERRRWLLLLRGQRRNGPHFIFRAQGGLFFTFFRDLFPSECVCSGGCRQSGLSNCFFRGALPVKMLTPLQFHVLAA